MYCPRSFVEGSSRPGNKRRRWPQIFLRQPRQVPALGPDRLPRPVSELPGQPQGTTRLRIVAHLEFRPTGGVTRAQTECQQLPRVEVELRCQRTAPESG